MEVHVTEYTFSSNAPSEAVVDEFEIFTSDVTGKMLDAAPSSSLPSVEDKTDIRNGEGKQDAPPSFISVTVDAVATLDIPDRIELSPDQLQETSAIVLVLVVVGGLVLALTVSCLCNVRSRRKTKERLAWLDQQSDIAKIENAMAKIKDIAFHTAASRRRRLLKFSKQANYLLNEANHKEFDQTRWIVVNRLSRQPETHEDVGTLLTQLEDAIDDGKELESFDRVSVAKMLEDLQTCHQHIAELKACVMEKISRVIASREHNGWRLQDWTRLLDLWHALGLDERDLSTHDDWYHTTRAELEARDVCLTQLARLHTICTSDDVAGHEAALGDMETLLHQAQVREWTHETLHQMERFVQSRKHDNEEAMVIVAYEQNMQTLEANRAALHSREDAIAFYVEHNAMTRAEAVVHVERMIFDYTLHRERLDADKQTEERKLRENRRMHMETLVAKHQRERQRAQEKWERDRQKYKEKVSLAAEAFERRQAMKAQKRKEAQEKEERQARQQWLERRSIAEWEWIQWVLLMDFIVAVLIVAVVFWDTVATSSDAFSPACDGRTSYWTPNQLSIWTCQVFYGAKVAAAMVALVLVLSLLSYLNLALWGLGLLVALALYVFRASWKHMVRRMPHAAWIVVFNYAMGYFFSIDPWLEWKIVVNWRPLFVYIVYPVASLVLTVCVGIWVACDAPAVCFDTALLWSTQLVSSSFVELA
ncbi:unnamed protein product [Aphanomyces euteiches]|uniref:Uncharacterized protein n=1 Tax=Aphanomyces euteiches TaxID=100861 RepID=A0A6G0XN88_9STRA|nr:hypothetical protein Ae201684_003047 [Aphanomyces euteiches]KAH9098341.1 hypothetical protein Ae201684P_017556 [Aphanomyces euteiches]KAH9155144.1 hypothetical protein AeRB84_002859 [Aphanomyces euteiches]